MLTQCKNEIPFAFLDIHLSKQRCSTNAFDTLICGQPGNCNIKANSAKLKLEFGQAWQNGLDETRIML